ncbi:MAG: hypothetical protein ACREBV_00040 [Candidatus Zixiibacteriota bacterium]
MELLGIWIGAVLTLGIYSFLYKDNPVYKVSEAIFIGVSSGYWGVTYFFDAIYKKFWLGAVVADEKQLMLYGGAVLGLLFLTRLHVKTSWIARWPLAFIVGATAGLYMMNYFVTNGLNQVAATISDVAQKGTFSSGSFADVIGTYVILVGVITGLIYFFFSKEHKGAFGGAAKVGIWFLMITFGASFGYTVMSRMSLLIGRMDFLLGDWLHIIN